MNEAAAKALLLSHVRHHGGRKSAVVTAELSLGGSSVRADLALLADKQLIGFEIKTERDTLRRLPAQAAAYADYFDHVVIAVAPRHVQAVRDLDLHGAAIWQLSNSGIEIVQDGKKNVVRPTAHLDLMTREERQGVLMGSRTIREHYCEVFQKRYRRTSNAFWEMVSGRKIRSQDIKHLSRYTEQRDAMHQIAREREERWDRWREAYSSFATAFINQPSQSSSVS